MSNDGSEPSVTDVLCFSLVEAHNEVRLWEVKTKMELKVPQLSHEPSSGGGGT